MHKRIKIPYFGEYRAVEFCMSDYIFLLQNKFEFFCVLGYKCIIFWLVYLSFFSFLIFLQVFWKLNSNYNRFALSAKKFSLSEKNVRNDCTWSSYIQNLKHYDHLSIMSWPTFNPQHNCSCEDFKNHKIELLRAYQSVSVLSS